MPTSMIIVDDFLDNADGLCAAALRRTYREQSGELPGRNPVERIDIDGLPRQVSHLIGALLQPMPPAQSHAKCRITLARDVGKAKRDVDTAHWSGILS